MEHEGDITDSARWQEAYSFVDSLVKAELGGDETATVKLHQLFKKAEPVNEYAARSLDTILRSLQVAEKVVVEEKFPSTLIRLMTAEERADREKRRNWASADSKVFSLSKAA
jgi:hypothetical protein